MGPSSLADSRDESKEARLAVRGHFVFRYAHRADMIFCCYGIRIPCVRDGSYYLATIHAPSGLVLVRPTHKTVDLTRNLSPSPFQHLPFS